MMMDQFSADLVLHCQKFLIGVAQPHRQHLGDRLKQFERQPLVLLLESIELLASQHENFGVFHGRGVVEAAGSGNESDTAEKVTASVRQGVVTVCCSLDGQGDPDLSLIHI